jgi:hypothetical protein
VSDVNIIDALHKVASYLLRGYLTWMAPVPYHIWQQASQTEKIDGNMMKSSEVVLSKDEFE